MDDQPPRNAPPTLRMPTEHVPNGTPGTGRDGQPVTDLGRVVVTADVDGKDACDVCRSTGLAILPIRQAAVPSPCAGLGGLEPGRGCAEEIASSGFGYALRTLRQGMLYLFYESGPAGTDYWEAYAIASNGTLWKQATAASARLIVGGGQPACSREGHDATRMEFIVIPKPDQCGTVWLAFSQDKWTDETLERYASDADSRMDRMQAIEPAEWIGSPGQGADRAPVNAAADLKVVMEYATIDNVVGDHPDLPFQGPVQPISHEDGSFDQRVLELNATRYRWSLRNQRLATDREPDISLETSYAALRGASRKAGSGQSATFHTPMMLALWDPIGIVHELNGYRHDVLGHIVRYQEERGLETDAFEGFRQIDMLLQQHAGVMAGKLKEAAQDRMREEIAVGDQYAMVGLYGDERALIADHKALISRYREGRVGWEEYEAARSRSIVQHVGPGRRSGVEERFRSHDGVRQLDTPGYWERSEALASAMTRQRATRDWNEKYKPLFDEPAIDRFQQHFERLLDAASRLLEQRSHAVAQWLQNELFLAVLEDYDKADPASGVLFEEAVTAALDGLAVDRVGRTTLESLADNLSVTERSCVLWRVVAQNQGDACEELEQVLKEADSLKDLVMDAAGVGWQRFVTASSYLKKFLGHYKRFEEVQKEAVPSTSSNAALRATGVDRFVVATGAVLLNRFPLRHIDNSVGNFLVRHVLQVRAGMDAVESSNLITTHARTTPGVTAYYAERVRHYRASPRLGHSAQFLALRDVESHRGVAVMRTQWQRAIGGVDNPVRLAGLSGVLELVNFVSILSRADKTAKDYGALAASGLAMASTYASVSMAVNKELFTDTSRSYGNVKAVGSALGGAATMIGVMFDVLALQKSIGREEYGLALVYGSKVAIGLTIGSTQVLTAFAYSAPVVQSALGRGGAVTFLTSVRHGIEGAAALQTAKAAGQAASSVTIRQGAMVGVGRFILYLGGWQMAVGVTALRAMIWVLAPNALEEWCERNHFGRVREKNRLGFGGSKPKYQTRETQAATFASAIHDVGIAPQEESENEEEEPA